MNIIEAEGINKFFGAGQNRVHVLKDKIGRASCRERV